MSERPEVPEDETLTPLLLEDDPENGVFWGPPDELDGSQRPWSRPWYEWRG